MAEQQMDGVAVPQEGFDREEPNAGAIALLGVGVIVVLVAVVIGLQLYYDTLKEEQVYVKVLAPESEDLRNLRAREDTELHSYGYIDREQGTVRLTIDRAMELLVAEAAAGKLPYPTSPYPVKPEEEASGGANAATQ